MAASKAMPTLMQIWIALARSRSIQKEGVALSMCGQILKFKNHRTGLRILQIVDQLLCQQTIRKRDEFICRMATRPPQSTHAGRPNTAHCTNRQCRKLQGIVTTIPRS